MAPDAQGYCSVTLSYWWRPVRHHEGENGVGLGPRFRTIL
ncbi:hypothetical protein HRbin28_00118 [bacterium HR28]|nr:hypothetical protein HRbin28_00118 [bacterium HR28]